MTRKVCITGARGFIGKNLVEHMARTHEVCAVDMAELDLVDEAAVDRFLEDGRFDVVIHTAVWGASRNASLDQNLVLRNNLLMYLNLARRSHRYGKMIYFGSGAEYCQQLSSPLAPESALDRHLPQDDYSLAKYLMAHVTRMRSGVYELIPFAVYGKHEDWVIRFISNACCKALFDLPITIRQNRQYDYLYVDDLSHIAQWFMDNDPEKRRFNVCTSQPVELLALARMVRQVSGKDLPIEVEHPGMGREYSGDNSRLLAAMGGYDFKPHRQGIEQLYGWYSDNRDHIDPAKLHLDG